MRPIKFRAWDLQEETYLEPTTNWRLKFKNGKTDSICLPRQSAMSVKKRFILEQFTGLVDKNNVDIYEGDILEVPDHYEGDMGMSKDNMKVIFEDGEFYLTSDLHPYTNLWDMVTNEKATVIGNIYENKELISNAK